MTVIDGYFITQNTRSNSISIMLPQRWDTMTNTVAPVSNRRLRLTDDEEVVLLGVIKAMFEGEEGFLGGEDAERAATNREWLAEQIKTLPPEDVYDLLKHIVTDVGKEYNNSRIGVAQWLKEKRSN